MAYRKNQCVLATSFFLFFSCGSGPAEEAKRLYGDNLLHKLSYNNPGLIVDLDAGFKALPLPMDFDGDGDLDLLISESGSYTESGIFYFENISGNIQMPLFRRRMKVSFERRRLGEDGARFQVSEVQGRVHVLTPDRVREKLIIYKDVPENVFWDENEVMLPEEGFDYLHNCKTEWKLIDFDGDGIHDLLAVATNDRPRSYRGKVGKLAEKLEFVTDGKNHVLFFKNKGGLNCSIKRLF